MSKRSRIVLTVLGCMPFINWAQGQQGTSVVTGSIVDTSGSPVAGATVRLRKTPNMQFDLSDRLLMRVVRSPGDFDFEASATTMPGGSFILSKLRPGAYVACAEFSSGYVDTCEWTGGVALTVPAVSNLRMTATPAALVSVQVNDPKSLLTGLTELPQMPHLVVGVMTGDGAYHPAALTTNSSTGRTYTARVLSGRDVTVRAGSAKFLLGDALGTPLASESVGFGSSSAVGKPSNFVITVTGVRQ